MLEHSIHIEATPTAPSRKLTAPTARREKSLPVASKTSPKGKAFENRLIAALPERDRHALLADCELRTLQFEEVLTEQNRNIRDVYFPLDSFVSLVTMLDDGHKLEVGMVGNEGLLGVSLALGITTAPHLAVVQGSGTALRVSAKVFLQNYEESTALRQLSHRYVHVLMTQLAQTAACTHFHLLEARLARWLLITRDRAHSDEFPLTQKFLAYMMGVRRVGVSVAASALHKRGVIDYRRGKIVIQDAQALEQASCACYAESKRIYERTMRLH